MAKSKKKTAGPLRAVHYERCSADDKKFSDFTTIENQDELNVALIGEKGWLNVGGYSDRGKTGTNLERAGFKKLLKDAQDGKFDVVVVTYMSRLARGGAFHAAEYLLKMAGVRIEMVKEQFGDDLAGQINRDVTIMIDGIQPKQAAEHTRTKMEGMVRNGYFCGSTPPFGYKKVVAYDATGDHLNAEKEPPKRLVPDSDDAEVVKQAFAMKRARLSQTAIRDYLNTVTNSAWDLDRVKRLITNERYIGIYQFGAWRNECAHPPIIDRDIFDEVQRILAEEEPNRSARSDKADDYVYYLRGKGRCPYCKCSYTQYSTTGDTTRVHYYTCALDNKRQTKCPVKRLNADALHYTVLTLIERAARHHTIMHQLIAQSEGWSSATEEQKNLRGMLAKKRAGIQTSIGNIVKAIEGGRSASALLNRLTDLEKEERAVTTELQKAEREIVAANVERPTADQVQESWGAVLDVWHDLTEEEKAELLGALVEDFEVKAKDRIVLRLAPFAEVSGLKLAINSHLGPVPQDTANYPTLRLEATVNARKRGRACKAA